MSYPKSNLGAIVLPVPDQMMTWEQYKDIYGVDLDEIFKISLNKTYFKDDFSKVVYMFDNNGNQSYFRGVIAPVAVSNATHDDNGDIPEGVTALALLYIAFDCNASAVGASGIIVIGNRTITLLDN